MWCGISRIILQHILLSIFKDILITDTTFFITFYWPHQEILRWNNYDTKKISYSYLDRRFFTEMRTATFITSLIKYADDNALLARYIFEFVKCVQDMGNVLNQKHKVHGSKNKG